MDQLKLAALDAEDLAVISAHLQDAVLRVEDLVFLPAEERFAVALNRFAWEKTGSGLFNRGSDERRRAVLHFDRVTGVKTTGINREQPDDVLSLLAIDFKPAELPAGTLELVFAGSAAVRLDVECIEARLTDLGGAWAASSRPQHRI